MISFYRDSTHVVMGDGSVYMVPVQSIPGTPARSMMVMLKDERGHRGLNPGPERIEIGDTVPTKNSVILEFLNKESITTVIETLNELYAMMEVDEI